MTFYSFIIEIAQQREYIETFFHEINYCQTKLHLQQCQNT